VIAHTSGVIQASELIIERTEQLEQQGPLSLGSSQIELTAEEPAVHLEFLRMLYGLPVESFASAVIKIAGLELDEWRKLPRIEYEFPSGLGDSREDGNTLDVVVKKYVEIRRSKRQQHRPLESDQN
jgi:hypothetical protein